MLERVSPGGGGAGMQSHISFTEPVFVDPSRNPKIDSGPVRQPYLSYWPARLHRLAKAIPRNRFLGSIIVYKYGLERNRG
jgi:hypothetical protein